MELQPQLYSLIKPCPFLGSTFPWVDFILSQGIPRWFQDGHQQLLASVLPASLITLANEFLFPNTWVEVPVLYLIGFALSTCYSLGLGIASRKVGGML